MNCKNCNAELSATAKFCTSCGTPVEQAPAPSAPPAQPKICRSCGKPVAEGVKFCSVCGTAVETPAQTVSVPPIAPPPFAPSAVQPVNNVAPAAAPQPVNDVVPAAAPQSVNDVAPAAIPQPVNDVAPAAAPQSVNDVAPAAAPQPVNDVMPAAAPQPVNDVMPAAAPQPVNNVAPAAVPQPVTAAPVASVTNGIDMDVAGLQMDAASAAVVKPVKKGGKVGLWITLAVIGVIAAVAVVCGLFFRGVVANFFMGDNKYAAMIEGNAIKAVTEDENYNKFIEQYAELFSANIANAATMAKMNSTINAGIVSESPFAGMDLEGMITAYNEQFMETYGTDGVTADFDFDVSLTEAAERALNLGENTDMILALINDTELSMSFQAAKDGLGLELAAKDGEGFTVSARGVVYNDGTVAVMIPFASDKCIKYTFDTAGNVASVEEVSFEIAPEELKRISTELVNIYLKYIELSYVTVNKDTVRAAGVEADGRLISVTMDDELLSDMLVEMFTFISEDDYIIDKLEELFELMGDSAADFNIDEEFDEAIEELEDGVDVDLLITSLVDNNGNLLAKSYCTDPTGIDMARVVFVSGEAEQGIEFAAAEEGTVEIHMTQTSQTDGKVRIDFNSAAEKYGINVDYKDVQIVPYLKNEAVVGEISIYFAGTEDSEASGSAATVEIEFSVDGDRMTNVIYMDFSEYGSFEVEVGIMPETLDLTEIPSDSVDFTDADNWSADESKANAQYILDALNEIKAKCGENSSSTFATMISPLVEQGIVYFEDILTPMVDSDTISAQADRIDQLMTKLDDKYSANSSYVSDDLYDECVDVYNELDDISDDVSYKYEMKQEEFNEIVADVDALETRVNDLCDRIDQTVEEAKSQSAAQGAELIGMWQATMISGFGETMTAEEAEFTMYVYFYDDGSYMWNWDGEVTTGLWTLEGETLRLVEDDWYYDFVYANGSLSYLADADITVMLEKIA